MSSHLSAAITVESKPVSVPVAPLAAVRTPESGRSVEQEVGPEFELRDISCPPDISDSHDPEVGQPISEGGPTNNSGASSEQFQTIWNPYKNRFRVLACCTTAFGNGMNDSAPGALLASIERHYNITYGTVATIFICNAIGFIAAAFFISPLSTKLGRAKALMIAEALLIIGYTILVITPPFPVVAVSFFILGVGMAINLAIGQVFCSNLANNTALLGAFQGSYGIGGITGPLIATSMVSQGYPWSRFYFIELGLAALNLVLSAWAFWNYEKESDHEVSYSEDREMVSQQQQQLRQQPSNRKSRSKTVWQSFSSLVSDKPTVLGSLFIFAYQGAEVAISGWIISFLVQFRHGDPSKVGFVTSGFWAGITLGRFTLSFLAHQMGERRFVFIVTAGALILELLIWFVPSIPGDSVAVAFSGLLLGPVYPCAVHQFQRLIPRKMQISSLSLIGSVGSSGGAVAPFMTGMIAQKAGTFVLHPICIGLFVAMAASWWFLPDPEKRRVE